MLRAARLRRASSGWPSARSTPSAPPARRPASARRATTPPGASRSVDGRSRRSRRWRSWSWGRSPCSLSSATRWRASSPALGIGGVALALAAQKTVENLFGSRLDRRRPAAPGRRFREGRRAPRDGRGIGPAVDADPHARPGRWSRSRTASWPISRSESFTARDRMRLACSAGPRVRDDVAEQLRAHRGESRRVLRQHPRSGRTTSWCASSASARRRSTSRWWPGSRRRDSGEFRRHPAGDADHPFPEISRCGRDRALAYPTRTLHVAPRKGARRSPGAARRAGRRGERDAAGGPTGGRGTFPCDPCYAAAGAIGWRPAFVDERGPRRGPGFGVVSSLSP